MTITHSIHKSLTIEGTPVEDPEGLENGVKYFIETGSGFAGAYYNGVVNGKYTFFEGHVKYTYSVDNTDVLTGVYLPE